ncbi:MAG: sugar phosphate nucleotidyltransferase [Minisyncoccia bacterium]
MIPINGKPVIDYIIEDLISRSIVKVIVILHEDDNHTEKYITKKFHSKCVLTVIYYKNGGRGSIGCSVSLARPYLKNAKGVIIYLGDTIYKGRLIFNNNFLVVSDVYESPEKWCFIEKNDHKFSFINKPEEYTGKGKILCGLYYFKNSRQLTASMVFAEKKYHTPELSHILEKYSKNNTFKLINADRWYDLGNIENFYKARIDLLKLRSFNTINYDDLRGYITKSGHNIDKIVQEINWFRKMPNDLKIFSPRLIDYKISPGSASYSLEFYGYQSLADFFVLGTLGIKFWQNIIDKLFNILELFKAHKASISRSHYYTIYYKKTIERLGQIDSNPYWKKLIAKDTIKINGIDYRNINHFKEKLARIVDRLYDKDEVCFIHGDLCLSNILFDPGSGIFKFIDPRGNFGKTSIYGDIKYDIAKMRHSFCGLYDFIMSDLFELKETGNGMFTLIDNAEDYHRQIGTYFDSQLVSRGYDLKKIKLIEALLFLSMIPIHSDNPMRQKAMYLVGIRLINENMMVK